MIIHNTKLSSKCCLEDTVAMWTGYEEDRFNDFIKGTDFCLDLDKDLKPINKINILSYKDIVPYLPRCESIMCMNKDKRIIVLQHKPHWLYEEENHINYLVDSIKKIINRCKRKKIDFIVDEHINEIIFGRDDIEYIYIISERLLNLGKKANFADIHLEHYNNFYREPLIDTMVAVGYTQEQAHIWAYENRKTW